MPTRSHRRAYVVENRTEYTPHEWRMIKLQCVGGGALAATVVLALARLAGVW